MKAKREQILIRTSWISTIGNAILSTSKIIVGLWAGSLAVLGDGCDHLHCHDFHSTHYQPAAFQEVRIRL